MDPENDVLAHNEEEDVSTVQQGLEAGGVTVHRVAFGNHTEDGGAIRCATRSLVRDFRG